MLPTFEYKNEFPIDIKKNAPIVALDNFINLKIFKK